MLKIIGIDPTSALRGVGRYVGALTELQGKINNKIDLVINPFFSVGGGRLEKYVGTNNAQMIAVVHDIIPLLYRKNFPTGLVGWLRQKWNFQMLSRYTTIVTDSEKSKDDIITHLNKFLGPKINVIHPYSSLVDVKPIRTSINIVKNSYVLYVGDVNWNKNIVNMLNACIRSNTKLICVGKMFTPTNISLPANRELDDFRQFMRIALSSPEKVDLLGFVPDGELAQLYTNALCNLLVSRDEGFGYSYIESATFSTPSILSDIPVFREISQSKGALFANCEDADKIAQSITALKNSPEMRQELGEEARMRSLYFSKKRFLDEWFTLLQTLNMAI
jgi:glycosyltransferase involved in cell wall biosynthesis